MTLLEAALGYEKLGWSVFPLKPRDKTPLIKWQAYQTRRAAPDEIKAWWKKWPDANIGVATGTISGFIVMDIDSEAGQEAYIAEFGELHNTIRQTTGKPGGLHLLFKPRADHVYRNMARAITGVDVRGDGGYIVLAPSIHPNGTRYKWDNIDPIDMGLADLVDIPNDVHGAITQGSILNTTQTRNEEGWVNELLLVGVKEGARNETLAKLTGHYLNVYDGDTELVEPILLNWDSLRCDPPLGFKVIHTSVQSVARTRKRKMMGEFAEKLNSLTKVIYPDGEKKYQIRINGYAHHVEVDFATLTNNRLFNIAVGELIDYAAQPIKGEAWRKIINNLLKESKTIEASIDETPTGLVLDVIKKTTPKTDLETYFRRNMVVQNETLFFQLSTFIEILQSYNIKSIDNRKLGKILRNLGFKTDSRKIKNMSVRLWMIQSTTWPEKAGPWPFAYYKTEDSQ